MMRKKAVAVPVVLFCIAAGLRVMLFLANPPSNAFDNHFLPVYLILKNGAIPRLDACWECYQPPVFYLASALIGKLAAVAGIAAVYLPKLLQSLCCFYGILHLGVIYLILRKLPVSGFSRKVGFAVACFLPAHIYICAMHSNDTLSYLVTSLCVYFFITALEQKFAVRRLFPLSIMMTVAIFTKYTALAVIPAVIITVVAMRFQRVIVSTKELLAVLAVICALPLACLGFYCAFNIREYRTPLPSNHLLSDSGKVQPKAPNVDFVGFRPWLAAKDVVLTPRLLGQFWTQIHAKAWFDTEPKFLYFTDPDDTWWSRYYGWLRGDSVFPSERKRFSLLTRLSASGLMALGLVPLFLLLAGCARREAFTGSMLVLPSLLLMNLAIVIVLTLDSPVYSSMKAIYLLNSLPAFAALAASGTMRFEKYAAARKAIVAAIALLAALVIVHIAHIAYSAGFFSL